jgi:hypothetical protein
MGGELEMWDIVDIVDIWEDGRRCVRGRYGRGRSGRGHRELEWTIRRGACRRGWRHVKGGDMEGKQRGNVARTTQGRLRRGVSENIG